MVEKASIDEAYILLAGTDDAFAPLGLGGEEEGAAAGGAAAQLALQRAQEAKAAGGRHTVAPGRDGRTWARH